MSESAEPWLISLKDMALDVCIGVTVKERAHPTRLGLSLEIAIDLTAAARSDDLSDTLDYLELVQLLRAEAARKPRQLLESLLEELCHSVHERWPQTCWIRMSLEKPGAIPDALPGVTRFIQYALQE